MNCLYKLGCRIYQKALFCATPLMNWREPQLLKYDNGVLGLPLFVKSKNIQSILIITGGTISKLGLVDGLIDGLKKENIKTAVFNKAQANTPIDNIEEALAMYNASKCQAIIAFGGGSPMDCAKVVAARVARPHKPVEKMKGLLKINKKIPTLIAIPTTSGTGSETTLAAVVSNSKTHEKYAINDPVLIPHYAVLDPTLTVGLPKDITASTGMDALTHAVEAYIGHSNITHTREMAIKSVKLIFANLKKAYDDGADIEARANMQLGSYYAGVAFTRAYVGYVHAIAHTIGGFYGVAHGVANATILPIVMQYYGESAHKRLAELAAYIGIDDINKDNAYNANIFIQAIINLNESMNIPKKISCIQQKDIPTMVERAMAEANPLYPVPAIYGKKELTEIFDLIME